MTLERILEPEVMDSTEEAREYNQMDHSQVNQDFVAELLLFANQQFELAVDQQPIDVLDLGTGTALIPIELCQQNEDCRVMAIDMAVSMLDLAMYNVAGAGFETRIQLGQVDAKQMPYDDHTFDAVISNSIIHHLPEPESCLQQVKRVVKSGGAVFVRDLMRPQSVEQVDHLVAEYTGQESECSRRLFRDSLLAALSLEEIQDMVQSLGYGAETVTATSDRHWTWAAIS